MKKRILEKTNDYAIIIISIIVVLRIIDVMAYVQSLNYHSQLTNVMYIPVYILMLIYVILFYFIFLAKKINKLVLLIIMTVSITVYGVVLYIHDFSTITINDKYKMSEFYSINKNFSHVEFLFNSSNVGDVLRVTSENDTLCFIKGGIFKRCAISNQKERIHVKVIPADTNHYWNLSIKLIE